jgi:hypothetical protein
VGSWHTANEQPQAHAQLRSCRIENRGHPSDEVTEQCYSFIPSNVLQTCDQFSSNSVVAIMSEGATLVASLRANRSIPYCMIPQIVESINEISQSAIAACHDEAVEYLRRCVADSSVCT